MDRVVNGLSPPGLLRLQLAMTDFLSFRHCERSEAIQTVVHDMKEPAVYIMANKRNGTLYTGVTSNLPKRAWEHREGVSPGFTKRYGCKLLVWFERHDVMTSAIEREKQIKAGSRKKKLALIEATNPQWRDLYEGLV